MNVSSYSGMKVSFGALIGLLIICANSVIAKEIDFDQQLFTVLSPTLISVRPADKQKTTFVYAGALKVDHSVKKTANSLVVGTDRVELIYDSGEGSVENRIKLKLSKAGAEIVTPINLKDKKNLGGLIKSVDRADGRLQHKDYDVSSAAVPVPQPKGLLSERGWTVLKTVNGRLVHGDDPRASDEFYIFAYGDDYKAAIADFVKLNGRVPMLPKWSLGTWFSRYQPLSDNDYKKIVDRFRAEKIPIDVILPDMNWHIDSWFGMRYDTKNFPDMKGFFEWAKKTGIHVGFNHHPGAVHRDDSRSLEFIKRLGWEEKETRKKSDKQYKSTGWGALENTYYYGEWNPDYVKPFFDVFLAPIMDEGLDFNWVDGHISFGVLREYYRLSEEKKQTRTIVLSRQEVGSFDHHRYPLGFSADTYISWESLKYNIEMNVHGANMSVYWSHDIGGHMERFPDLNHREMFARWVQSGAMSPITRLHATGGVEWDIMRKMHVRRPWEWGEKVLKSSRDILQLKYKLMPYLYSLNRMAYDTGLVMLRGNYIDYPQYANAYKYANSQYLLGSSILVAPITEPAANGEGIDGMGFKNLWVPEGTWFDFFSGENITGPVETLVAKPIDEMPLFIKEGAILPMAEYMEHTDQKPLNNLVLEFYQPTRTMQTNFDLYEDDGKTLEYKKGQYRSTTIEYSFNEETGSNITIHPATGSFKNAVGSRSYTLRIKHVQEKPTAIKVDGRKLSKKQWTYSDNTIDFNVASKSLSKALNISF